MRCSALPICGVVLLLGVASGQDAAPPALDTSGAWSTTFGVLTLEQEGARVRGTYRVSGPASLEGTLSGRRLTFRYREPDAAGQGWFEFDSDGRSFQGRWRAEGETEWAEWKGTRAQSPQESGPFAGLFDTTQGRVRLFQAKGSEDVRGLYRYSGNAGTIQGRVEGATLRFRWKEGESSGEGEFSLEDGALTGRWRSGESEWKEWGGPRVQPKPNLRWLMVLEAQWEEAITQQEYSFGAMLKAYMRRFPHVEVRQRRFADRPDFVREARELAFLAEPVVLLVASHGEGGRLQASGEEIDPKALGTLLADAPTVELVHFSSCEMMVGTVPLDLRAQLPPGRRLPISGYAVSVDWSASALLEFLYLDLILGRGQEPARAAEVVRKELRFSGDVATPGSPLGAAQFRFSE